jgi:hypothetical protein
MDYFDSLAQGSKYHRAKRIKEGLRISACEKEIDPRRIEFNKIARQAEKHALREGRRFKPHYTGRDSYGWDSARIIFKEAST